jgi:hypothetical protein
MIEGQDDMERTYLPTFCWSSTNKGSSAQICMGVFFIRSVSLTIFATYFIPKPPADHRGPPMVCAPQF